MLGLKRLKRKPWESGRQTDWDRVVTEVRKNRSPTFFLSMPAPEVPPRNPAAMCPDWQILVWGWDLDISLWDPWPSPAALLSWSHTALGTHRLPLESQMPGEVLSTAS